MTPTVQIATAEGSLPDPRLENWAKEAGFAVASSTSPGSPDVCIWDLAGSTDRTAISAARGRYPGAILVAAAIPGDGIATVVEAGCDDYLEDPLDERRAVARLRLLQRRLAARADGVGSPAAQPSIAGFFRASPVATSITDEAGHFVAVSASYSALYGRSRDDLVGKHFTAVIPPSQREAAREIYRRFVAGEEAPPAEAVVVRADGARRVVRTSLWASDDLGGRRYVVTTLEDITHQRAAEHAASEAEHDGNDLAFNLGEGLAVIDSQRRCLVWNPAMVRITGVEPEQIVGRRMDEVFDYPAGHLLREGLMRALQGETVDCGDLPFQAAVTGQVTWVRVLYRPRTNSAGAVTGAVALHQDVTYRRQVEEQLRDSEQRLRSLLETSPDLVLLLDLEGRVTFADGAFERVLGCHPEDLLGRPLAESVHADDLQRASDAFRRVVGEGVHVEADLRITAGGGNEVWVEAGGGPLRSANGETEAVVTIFRDITARRRAEAAARESEGRFREIANATPALIWIADSNGSIEFVNQACLDHTGSRPAGLVGGGWQRFLHPDDLERAARIFRLAAQAQIAFTLEYRLLRHDGDYRWILTQAVPRYGPGGELTGYIGSGVDITANRRAAEEVRRLSAILKVSQEASLDGILVVGLDRNPLSYNQRYLEIWGLTPELMAGPHRGRDEVFRRQLKLTDAAVSVSAAAYGDPRATVSAEVEFLDGRVIDVHTAPLLGDDGEPFGRVWYSRDITERRMAESAVRESEERYRRMAEHSPDAIAIHRGLKLVYLNAAGLRLLGAAAPEEVIGRDVSAFFHPEDWPLVLQTGATSGGEARFAEVRLLRLDGAETLVELGSTGTVYEGARATQSVLRDISVRHAAAEALRASEEKYRSLFERVPVAVFRTAPGGRMLAANPAAVSILGYDSEEDLLALADLREAYFSPSDRETIERTVTGGGGGVELTTRKKDGSPVTLLLQVQVFRGPDGQVVYNEGTAIDITERRAAEEKLRASEEKYRALFQRVPAGVYQTTRDARLLTANPALVRLLGFDSEEQLLATQDIRGFYVDPAQRAMMVEVLEATRGAFHGELRLRRRDGQEITVLENARAVRDPNGDLLYYEGTLTDITERKRAEEELRKSEQRFARAFHANPAATGILSYEEGRFIDANDAFAELLGLRREEIVGHAIAELDVWRAPDDRVELAKAVRRAGSLGPHEGIYRRSDGQLRHTLDSFEMIELGGQLCMLSTSIDITERREAERELRKSEERFSRAFNASPAATSILNYEDGSFTDANAAFAELVGRPREEIIGRTLAELDIGRAPEEQEEVGRAVRRSGSYGPREGVIRRPDGDLRNTLDSWEMMELGGQRSILSTSIDITDRKRVEAERLALERKLLEAQKLESLGVLAGGIAHDFNNLLVAIMGNANLALMEVSTSSPATPYLHEIETASERAADLARQMLAYSGRGQFVVEPVDLSGVVQEMGNLLHVSIPKKVVLYYNLTAGIPAVDADPTQLRQVLMNLVINAAEAIGDNAGQVTVSTGMLHASRADLAGSYLQPDLPDGDYVYVDVVDTGCGMDAATRARIFDPFFTTKFTGRGLGLAAVLGIVRRHGGAIKVDSAPGEGSTFRLLLPVAARQPLEAPMAPVEAAILTTAGTVLIADDEPAVLTVTTRMLERMGFRVLAAGDGREALVLFEAHREHIALVLLDMTMPEVSGDEAVLALRAIDPHVPLLLMSGYSEQHAASQLGDGALAGFVQKPFSFAELQARVSAALE